MALISFLCNLSDEIIGFSIKVPFNYQKAKPIINEVFNLHSLLFLFTLGLTAQSNYKFSTIATQDGLSQSSVIAITQDKDGRMWLGTRDGLNLYDGVTFKTYRRSNKGNSISNNDVLSLLQDTKGYIWIGTYHGLNRFCPKTEKFTTYHPIKGENSLIGNVVWKIKELSNGNIAVTTSSGVSILNVQTNKWQNYTVDNGLPANHVLDIIQITEDKLLVGTVKGLSFINQSTKEVNVLPDASFYVQSLLRKENLVYIGTKSNGLVVYNIIKNNFIKEDWISNVNNNDIRSLLLTKNNNIWIGTANGLYIKDENRISHVQENASQSSSLQNNFIKTLYEDKKGSVWVGTYFGGVSIWDESYKFF